MNFSLEFPDHRVVNGLRVKLAREQAAMTQEALALASAVSQPMIAHIEQGLKQASLEVVHKIAGATGVRTDFLYKANGPSLPFGSMLFRARADVSARKFAQVHAIATCIFELFILLSNQFALPAIKLHPTGGTPEDAAMSVRRTLGVDEELPVPHLMRAFEKAGGVLLSLPELQGREAFAVWASNKPVIAIGPSRAGDRLRFSMAHEIGHLILHNAPTVKSHAEKEAHRFAAELLLPKQAVAADFQGGLDFEKLGVLKMKWGVSMAALLYRARELGFVSKRLHDRLIIQLAPFKQAEPTQFDIPIERPRVLRQMVEMLHGSDLGIVQLAEKSALTEDFVWGVLSRYASENEIAASQKRRKVINIETRKKKVTSKADPVVSGPILSFRVT